MWRVIICESDAQVCARLGHGLRRFGEDVHEPMDIACYETASELLAEPEADADVLFLSTRLADGTGFDVARALRRRGIGALVFLLTDEKPYPLEGFEVHAFGYVDKPISATQLRSQLEDALVTLRRKSDKRIVLRRSTNTDLLDVKDVVYVEALGHTITATLKDGTQRRCSRSLAELEEQLKGSGFFRCHKSYLVNMAYLRTISRDRLIMTGGSAIPLSKHRKQAFLQNFGAGS